MRRFHFRTALIAGGVLLLPTIGLAATFQGPSQTPPNGNVPGVIWNVAGTSASQYQAKVNFGTPITGVPYINAISDFGFTNGKALRVDVDGPATLNMGNWGGSIVPSQALTFTIYGGEKVTSIGPNPILGQDGRVQADKFCFNPGNPSDCIMSGDTGNWLSGGGSGLYVLKAGDTMSGTLDIITGSQTAIQANGATYGIKAIGPTAGDFLGTGTGVTVDVRSSGIPGNSTGLRSTGHEVAGDFTGSVYGMFAKSPGGVGTYTDGDVYGLVANSQLGVGAEITGKTIGIVGYSAIGLGADIIGGTTGIQSVGNNVNSFGGTFRGGVGVSSTGATTGGIFYGPTQGVLATGGSYGINVQSPIGTGALISGAGYGVNADGATYGSIFSGSGGYTTYLAYPGYGAYVSVPAGPGMGFRASVPAGNYGMYTNGAGYFGGDLVASANTPAACATETVAAGAITYTCSLGKFMAGMRKNASNVVDGVVCCDL